MKQLPYFFFILFFLSCESDEITREQYLTKSVLIGDWIQITPFNVLTTNQETGITEELKFNEVYTFQHDNRFRLGGDLYLKIGDMGNYNFNQNHQVIEFVCEGKIIEINGSLVQLEKTPQRWRWSIMDKKGDTLTVSLQNYDKINNQYDSFEQTLKFVKK